MNVIVEEQCLSDIASAIRAKTGESSTYYPSQMASAIGGIAGGKIDELVMGTIRQYSASVSSVRPHAFYGCSNLSAIDLPSCTKTLTAAFYSCESLTSVSMPTCTTIGIEAFAYCTALESINLPECKLVSDGAFMGCTSLSVMSLPKCSSIRHAAFQGCHSLSLYLLGPSVCRVSTSVFEDEARIYVPSGSLSTYLEADGWGFYYSQMYDMDGEWGGDYFDPESYTGGYSSSFGG
jgi:hypothetical protein